MIAAWMLYSIAVAAYLAGTAWCLDRALRPYGVPIRWIWCGSMIGGAFGPLVPLVAGAGAPEGAPPASALPISLPEIATTGLGVSSALRALDPWLLTLWIGGSLLLLGFAARSVVQLRRVLGRSASEERLGVPVLVSDELGPAAVGLFRGRVVIPAWLADEPGRMLELAIRHEKEHVEAHDTALGPAGFLLLALLPWNVSLWWSFRRLREAIEIDCDRRVLEDRPRVLRAYAESLLAIGARGRPALAPVPMLEAGSFLERRIRAMTGARPHRPVLRGALLGSLAAVALVAACMSPSPDGTGDDPTSPALPASAGSPASPERTDAGEARPEREVVPEVVPQDTAPDEPAASAADREVGEPEFMPYAVAPNLRNRFEVQQALVDEYPPLLREAGIGGTIHLWFYIDERGAAQDVWIQESSGNEPLDQAAVRVARTMEFTPARNRDEAVAVWIELPITFTPAP